MILFCGGGTGGHVLPGLSVAAACRERGMDALCWIGDPERLEARLVPAAGMALLPYGLSRPRLWHPGWWFQALGRLCGCWRVMGRRRPVVVALGGYAALLPGLLAPLLRCRLIVLEQNAVPGRTNRLLARCAHHVVTQFPEAAAWLPSGRVRCLGNPVRPLRPLPRGSASSLRLLVMGGSLAARSLNDLLIRAAPQLAAIPGLTVVHLAGEEDRSRVAAAYRAAGLAAEVLGYCDEMPALYERVDMVLGRSGATSVAECCVAGLGAILIPLPWAADDHQTANARAVARCGGAVVLDQTVASPAAIAHLLGRLAADYTLVARLGTAAHRLARPEAARQVVELIRQEAA